jgi:hypothetical protein
MGRIILGIVAGIVAAFATIWALELVHHLLYPIPADVRLTDMTRLREFTRTLPLASQFFIAGGWLAGTVVGGSVAALVSRRDWTILVVAALVAVAGILNVVWLPHPLLLQIASVAAPAIGALIARALVRRRLAAPADGAAAAEGQ